MSDPVNDTTPPEENVDQHTIARFYLNLFSATPDKKVYVRERGGVAYGPKSTKTLTVEENAFAVFNGGDRDNSSDDVNSGIETRIAPHIKSLTSRKAVTKEEWNALWLLTANFLARSRRLRDWLKQMIQSAGLIAADIQTALPTDLASAAADINRAAEVLYPLMAAKGTESIALALQEKRCDLLITTLGSVFITSDDPAIVYVGHQPAMLQATPDFIERSDVEVFMALKPDVACLWSASSSGQVREITAEEVAHRNKELYDSCYKSVFSSRKSDLDVLLIAAQAAQP